MAVKLTSAREAAALQGLKLTVYGNAGSGKTTLCATTGAPTVILSAEAGLLSLRHTDIPVIEVKTMQDVQDAYQFLLSSPEGQQFEWVCLDSISEIAEVVLNAEKKATRDPRQAYGALQETMGEMIRAFRDLPGRNVYFSAKMERIKDEATGGLLFGPSLPGQKLGQSLPYFTDLVFPLRVINDEEGNSVRWLQTQPDHQHIAKDRSGALDAFEAPDLAAIAAKVRQS